MPASELMRIKPFIQNFVRAMSSILHAEVTVVDSKLQRVAISGDADVMGDTVAAGSYFAKVLESGLTGGINDMGKEYACADCARYIAARSRRAQNI
jgi:hypothetical protein